VQSKSINDNKSVIVYSSPSRHATGNNRFCLAGAIALLRFGVCDGTCAIVSFLELLETMIGERLSSLGLDDRSMYVVAETERLTKMLSHEY